MKLTFIPVLLATSASSARSASSEANPLGKALDLLAGLAAKVAKDGEEEAAAFKAYSDWCTETKRNTGFEITSASSAKDASEAKVSQSEAKITVSTSKIEELVKAIAATSSQLSEATGIRDKETADFLAGEKELVSVIDTIGRAVGILERELSRNPGAFTQLDGSNLNGLLATLSAVVDAAAFPLEDKERLTALLQAQQGSQDGELGAPAATAYESKSSSIVDLLEDLKDKADEQLRELRKAETNARHNFDLLKQSLETQASAGSKDLEDEKAAKSAAEQAKATGQGELEVATRELQAGQEKLAATTSGCEQVAADHEQTVKDRDDELKVIAQAIDILKSSTGGAASESYSLVQVASSSRMSSRQDLAKGEVVALVKKLARKHHSAALAQLASRLEATVRYSTHSGADPFAKVRSLIQDLLTKLQEEAKAEETEKAFCDAELSKTAAKRGELEDEVGKLDAKLGQAVAKSADLKQQVVELQAELAAIAKEQAELDKIRQVSHATYVQAKADLELGLAGVRTALGKLREYYGSKAALLQDDAGFGAMMIQPEAPKKHDKSGGASGIIGLLEVVESDFAKNLAEEEAGESDAVSSYEKVTQDNKLAISTKDGDVKYKSQEAASLDKTVTELTSDRETLGAELAAVLEYDGKLKERCVAKPETFEERAARRTAEVNGLKEALQILQNEVALAQRSRRVHVRGAALRP